MQHRIVQRVKKQDKGKAARALADKIFLAVRVDYFQGKSVAQKLLKELEERFQ
jgi:RNA processing factor Prp31